MSFSRSGPRARHRLAGALGATGLTVLALAVSGCSTTAGSGSNSSQSAANQPAASQPAADATPTAADAAATAQDAGSQTTPAAATGECKLAGVLEGVTPHCLSAATATELGADKVTALYETTATLDGKHLHVWPATLADDGSMVAILTAKPEENTKASIGFVGKDGFKEFSTSDVDPLSTVARSGNDVVWIESQDAAWQIKHYDGTKITDLAANTTVDKSANLAVNPEDLDLAIVGGNVMWRVGQDKDGTSVKQLSVPLAGGTATVSAYQADSSFPGADGTTYRLHKPGGGMYEIQMSDNKVLFAGSLAASGDVSVPTIQGDTVTWVAAQQDKGSFIYAYTPASQRFVQIESATPVSLIDVSVAGDRLAWSDADGAEYLADLTAMTVQSTGKAGASTEPATAVTAGGTLMRATNPAGAPDPVQADPVAFTVGTLK